MQEQLIGEDLDAETVKRYTEQFATIWKTIFPIEQYRILHLLIERTMFMKTPDTNSELVGSKI